MKSSPCWKKTPPAWRSWRLPAPRRADGHYPARVRHEGVYEFFSRENINSDIFIIDLTGKPVLTALGSGSEDPVATEVNIPQEMIKIAVATGMYSNESTMGGLYKKQHYVVGFPFATRQLTSPP